MTANQYLPAHTQSEMIRTPSVLPGHTLPVSRVGHALPSRAHFRFQVGAGLLEVLIAVILLSVGFLAAARMQVEGMRYSHDAYHLSQARFMLLDMTERMRTNRQALAGTAYRGKQTSAGTSDPACIINKTPCSAADIAAADLHAWSRNLHGSDGDADFIPLLPGTESVPARGEIDYDAGENAYIVSVQWSETVDGEETARSLAVRVFP